MDWGFFFIFFTLSLSHNVSIKSMIAYSLLDWNWNFNFLRNLNEREIREASALLALLENVLVNIMVEDKIIWKLSGECFS